MDPIYISSDDEPPRKKTTADEQQRKAKERELQAREEVLRLFRREKLFRRKARKEVQDDGDDEASDEDVAVARTRKNKLARTRKLGKLAMTRKKIPSDKWSPLGLSTSDEDTLAMRKLGKRAMTRKKIPSEIDDEYSTLGLSTSDEDVALQKLPKGASKAEIDKLFGPSDEDVGTKKLEIHDDESTSSSSSGESPRTAYHKRYFAKPVHMNSKDLFQVSFDSTDQFNEYENLTPKNKEDKIDCGYQTLFALGLLHVKPAKKGAKIVNRYGKEGVNFNDIIKMLTTNFELDDELEMRFIDMPDFLKNAYLYGFLKKELENGYATILLINGLLINGRITNHFIVAYKHNDRIFYYDPQQNKHVIIQDFFKVAFLYNKSKIKKTFTSTRCLLPIVG